MTTETSGSVASCVADVCRPARSIVLMEVSEVLRVRGRFLRSSQRAGRHEVAVQAAARAVGGDRRSGATLPSVGRRPLQPRATQRGVQRVVGEQPLHGPGDRLLVAWIHEQPGVADDLGQAGRRGGDDGRAARHRLQGREAVALVQRRVHEAARAGEHAHEVLVGQEAGQDDGAPHAPAAPPRTPRCASPGLPPRRAPRPGRSARTRATRSRGSCAAPACRRTRRRACRSRGAPAAPATRARAGSAARRRTASRRSAPRARAGARRCRGPRRASRSGRRRPAGRAAPPGRGSSPGWARRTARVRSAPGRRASSRRPGRAGRAPARRRSAGGAGRPAVRGGPPAEPPAGTTAPARRPAARCAPPACAARDVRATARAARRRRGRAAPSAGRSRSGTRPPG